MSVVAGARTVRVAWLHAVRVACRSTVFTYSSECRSCTILTWVRWLQTTERTRLFIEGATQSELRRREN